MTTLLRLLFGGVVLIAALAVHGQTMPQARLFAEGTISTPDALAVTFAPDGKTVFFTKKTGPEAYHIFSSENHEGKWSTPKELEFSGEYRDFDPFLSPDGKQLFFGSLRPIPGKHDGPGIWVSERNGDRWSAPQPLIEELAKSGTAGVFPSPVANGSLYFAGELLQPPTLGKGDIYCAKRAAKGYAAPVNLGAPINTEYSDYDAYVAPDESYMIFASDRPGGLGNSDMYISVRRNGAWTTPVNLGPSVNSESGLCCPAVSPDGKFFYFTTKLNGKQGIYEIEFPALLRALGIDLGDKTAGR